MMPATGRPLRIVRLANFVMATSGGLRTALNCLGAGYQRAGHDAVLVIPGDRPSDEMTEQGRVITLPGGSVPGSGGYRIIVGRQRLQALLQALAPDRLEVSDRFTLRWTGAWARAHGVPSAMVSHESLVGLLRVWGVPPALGDRIADRFNARSAASYDTIVCTTAWGAAEFRRIGVANLVEAPLGVDLDGFDPAFHDPAIRARYARPDEVLLVHCSRLSPEKQPELAIDTLAALRSAGVPAVLVVVGDGPRRAAMGQRAGDLPVHFAGFLPERASVASLLASADVVVAPGPAETFGLAGLEALACGTPVVVNAASALPEVAGVAGVAAEGTGAAFAAGAQELLGRPEDERRKAARTRAEQFSWSASVERFLRLHNAPVLVRDAPW